MKTSQVGIDLIKRNEGCRLDAYLDTVANPPVWTIGYGETGPYVYEGLRYTQDQAEMSLTRRLGREFEPGVMAVIGSAPTTQNQFDAMVSLAWNIGLGAFQHHCSVPRLHVAGDYAGAARSFGLWNKAGGEYNVGLTRRRAEEAALYLFGGGAAAPSVPHPFAAADPKQLQQRLVSLGYAVTVDGDAGPETCGAALAALTPSAQ